MIDDARISLQFSFLVGGSQPLQLFCVMEDDDSSMNDSFDCASRHVLLGVRFVPD